jgi:Raf kinase inhibitor-like YbhB/YbcL family protein
VAQIAVFSESISGGALIPAEFTCDGTDRSPNLRWGDPPAGAKSFAVVVDDPDATRGVFTHWLVYGLPADTRALAAGAPAGERLGNGGTQGKNDFGVNGYRGPCPPRGQAHEYRFFVYALDADPGLAPGVKAADLMAAMRGHVLAAGQLSANYQRR